MYKNTAGQYIFASVVDSSDGSAKTTGVDFYLTQDNGLQTAVNSATHVGNGQWRIDLTQAETNADVIGICWAGTNVVPGNITLYPVAKKTQDYQTELSRLDAAITSRLAAADVPNNFSSLAITETTGKVTVDNVDDCKADVSGLATSAEIAALNDFDPATEKVEIAGTKNRLDDLNDIDGSSVTVTTNNDKTGYALTTGERSSIADAVWAATTRTLSSFGTLVADTAAAVWGAVSRTLTAGTKDSEIAAIYGKLPTGSIADQATAEAVKAQTDKMNFNAESPTKILAEATANAEISPEDIEAMADQVVAGVLDAEEISRLAEGTGSTQYTYTVRDENESPIPDVRVWVYSNSGLTTLIARSATNNFGVCTFYLDPGTYYFVCQKAGYTFNNPDIETVSE
jgi:hypothetical protein